MAADDLPIYGLDAELKAKRDAAYDPDLENQAREWIEALTGESLGEDFAEALNDGQILCKVINAIKPGTIKKINKMSMPFMKMENINFYLDACAELGVIPSDSFQTVDLFEAKNMNQVVHNIHALGRVAQTVSGYNGPTLGAKLAQGQTRQARPDDEIKAASAVPLLAQGAAKGASQAGLVMGGRRDVITKSDGADLC